MTVRILLAGEEPSDAYRKDYNEHNATTWQVVEGLNAHDSSPERFTGRLKR